MWADDQAGVIGLSHAGWRGAIGGILESTLEKMLELGARAQQISVMIGPATAQTSYEVDTGFYQQFLAHSTQNSAYFKPNPLNPTHWYFDLPGYIAGRLRGLRLKTILNSTLDTYINEQLFFSCRRSKQLGHPDFDEHLTCIHLK